MTYRENPEIFKMYNSKKWKKLRKLKLAISPFCERCLEKGLYVSAYIIHHKDYVTDLNYSDGDVFYNLDNLESLCLDCHNKEHFEGKTKKEYIFNSNGDLVKKG